MTPLFPMFYELWRSAWPRWTTPAQSDALLRLLVLATEENLPLVPLVEQWAADERGVQRRRLRHLVRLLQEGWDVADALEATPFLLTDEALLAVRFDARLGTRAQAMRRVLASGTLATPAPLVQLRRTLLGALAVLVVAALVLVLMQYRILPTLRRIVQDFRLPSPGDSLWSLRIVDIVGSSGWFIALAVVVALWFAISSRAARRLRQLLMWTSLNPWWETHAAGVLNCLELTLNAGRPLAGAMATLARYHFNPTIRHQLLYVRNEMELGGDVWRSMQAIGLLSPTESQLLHTADPLGNHAWVLRQLAHARRFRAALRQSRRSLVLVPLVVFVLGSWVLVQALCVFQPLIYIMQSL